VSGGKRMSKPAAKAQPAMDVAVGQRIRELRRTRAMSLEAVAARTDLSIGFLSQIERGLSSPSLRVLATLADVLGVGIAGLFGAKDNVSAVPDAVVTRERQRAKLNLWRTGISKQLLSPAGSEGRLNLFLVQMEPGGSTGDELYTHAANWRRLRGRISLKPSALVLVKLGNYGLDKLRLIGLFIAR